MVSDLIAGCAYQLDLRSALDWMKCLEHLSPFFGRTSTAQKGHVATIP